MKRSDFTGTGKVFSFTLAQYLKSKSTIIMLVIMVVMSAASMFIMASSMRESSMFSFNIRRIYILNETDFDIQTLDIGNYSEDVGKTEIIMTEGGIDALYSALDNEPYSAAVHLYDKDGGLNIISYTGYESEVNMMSRTVMSEAVTDALNAARFRAYGISAGQINTAFIPFTVSGMSYKDFIAEQKGDTLPGMDSGYFSLSYFYSIIVIMLIMFSTSYIIRSIVEEKASRLVELLMVSVRPLALLTGKILATMVFMILSIIVLFAGTGISGLLIGNTMNVSFSDDILASAGINISFAGFGAVIFLIMLVSIVLGYLTFSIIGGISGASCSAMEDINAASTIVSMLALLGYFTALFVPMFGSRTLMTVLSLCPVISVFSAPISYAAGVISIWVLMLSWLVQLVTIVLLSSFGARVYASLIIHRGTRIKLRQIIRIARENKKKA